MNPAGRDRAVQKFPARSMDLSLEANAAHEIVRATMIRHHYKPYGEIGAGVATYRFGSLAKEFLNQIVPLDLFSSMSGKQAGSAKIAAWTEPVPGGVRLTISLVTGILHAKEASQMAAELIEEFRAKGSLIRASEPFTGFDLPRDSPGRPA